MEFRMLHTGKRDWVHLLSSDGKRIPLSRHQLLVLVTVLDAARGVMPTEKLYPIVFAAEGPATPSQRASLSRLVKRLEQRGFLTGRARRLLGLTEEGKAVASFAKGIGWLG